MSSDGGTDELRYWLGFSLVPAFGNRRSAAILQAFGSLSQAWHAPEAALRSAGMDQRLITNLLHARQHIDLNAAMTRIHQAGASLISYPMDEYPLLLRNIPDAPSLLYIRGALTAEDQRSVSIVGTRNATRYGVEMAYQLARELSHVGITVISGLAQGIDAAAHRGALDGKGRTIAVLGNGIDTVYPPQHRDLAAQIAANGAVITEFPIGAKPEAHHFPRRNRVISGMSLGVLIVEAPDKSGALITAGAALEQGREVFAVPGNINNPASRGTNRLIQDGAKLVVDVRDILEELQMNSGIARHDVREKVPSIPQHSSTAPPTLESDMERIVFARLSHEPIHVDDLIRETGLPTGEVLAALTMLELKDLARNVGGMQYCKDSSV